MWKHVLRLHLLGSVGSNADDWSMLNSFLWIYLGIDCWSPWHLDVQRVLMACSGLMWHYTVHMLHLSLYVRWVYHEKECISAHLFACMQSFNDPMRLQGSTLPLPGSEQSHFHVSTMTQEPRRLADLPASAILTDWSSMCYTAINGFNYQWAGLWTLKTEVNRNERSWGGKGGSISY